MVKKLWEVILAVIHLWHSNLCIETTELIKWRSIHTVRNIEGVMTITLLKATICIILSVVIEMLVH